MYQEKYSIFECGFHSFLGQNRSQFFVSFFLYAIAYLIFDLELITLYPYAVSQSVNSTYGLVVVIIFTTLLCIGFVFEINKNALNIPSKQNIELTSLRKILKEYTLEYTNSPRIKR